MEKIYSIVSIFCFCSLFGIGQVITNTAPLKTNTNTAQILQKANQLKGYVDMHTHLMSHLAFGGKVLYGAPDENTLMLKGSIYRGWDLFKPTTCNEINEVPGSVGRALSDCNAIHGGWGATDNNCGNTIRAEIVNKVDKIYVFKQKNGVGDLGHIDHPHGGYPNFTHWPHQSSVTHQQMWHEWIKRAYNGGLRVMVSLAVTNSLLAEAASADQYIDDKSSVELQLIEMRKFVQRHSDFMEIAKSPADLRRIVKANKLAVILGVETDDIGNLTRRSRFKNENISMLQIKGEISRLYYTYDVRYIFPVHMANNIFGGTAVNNNLFALSTKYYTNNYVEVIPSTGENIGYQIGNEDFGFPGAELLRTLNLGWIIDHQPRYNNPGPGYGHKNKLGLTALGISALVEMMKLGMMIDIDHMSDKAQRQAFQVARLYGFYPLNCGHNGIRGPNSTERNIARDLVDSIEVYGGMFGVGSTDATPQMFVNNYLNVWNQIGRKPIGIGTDVNGLEPLPRCTNNLDSAQFYRGFPLPLSNMGNKKWNYTKEGVAHYGLMPEFLKDVSMRTNNGMTVYSQLMESAEYFAQMWEKCERMNKRS
jgi:microsomal dipeptidase-like Zn-dependent dipeptidase